MTVTRIPHPKRRRVDRAPLPRPLRPDQARIIDLLRDRGEASVRDLTAALGTSQQNVSKHLVTLHGEGFLSRRKQGTSSLYAIADPAVLDLCEQVCGGIEAQLGELERTLRA